MNFKKLLSRKYIIFTTITIVLIVAGYFLFFNSKNEQELLTVHPADFLQEVSASGKITAKENLNLSFQEAGQVSFVPVKIGDSVYAGQLLASQNNGELQAQFSQMQAGVDLQEAKLKQLLAGASPEDVQIAQDAVTFAKQNLTNSQVSALATLDNAYNAIYNAYTTVSYMQNTYFYASDIQGIKVQDSKRVISDSLDIAKKYLEDAKSSSENIDSAISRLNIDLNNTLSSLQIVRQQCEEGVYYLRVSTTDKNTLDTQKNTITTNLSSLSTIGASIASYKVAITQAQNALTLKKSPPRLSDIAVYQAQIDQAKASLQQVVAQLNKKRIYSPINGIITVVNAKVGGIFSSANTAISVISKNNFEIESFIPQINISLISVGQEAKIILDSYGDAEFLAKVISIDPAETIKDGVSTYKVMLEFINNDDNRIKSGMTGNIVITTLKKSNVISVPQGIIIYRNGQKFVHVKNGENINEAKVETGSVSFNGNIEIISGLQDGNIVIVK